MIRAGLLDRGFLRIVISTVSIKRVDMPGAEAARMKKPGTPWGLNGPPLGAISKAGSWTPAAPIYMQTVDPRHELWLRVTASEQRQAVVVSVDDPLSSPDIPLGGPPGDIVWAWGAGSLGAGLPSPWIRAFVPGRHTFFCQGIWSESGVVRFDEALRSRTEVYERGTRTTVEFSDLSNPWASALTLELAVFLVDWRSLVVLD